MYLLDRFFIFFGSKLIILNSFKLSLVTCRIIIMEIEIRAVGDLVPFVQFKKRKKPTVLVAISMIMTKLCDMSLERTSKHLFADPLFHRNFSNTLLVKTNYLVYR